jgi:hypothetical protein
LTGAFNFGIWGMLVPEAGILAILFGTIPFLAVMQELARNVFIRQSWVGLPGCCLLPIPRPSSGFSCFSLTLLSPFSPPVYLRFAWTQLQV